MTYEQWLQAAGFDPLSLGDRQLAKLRVAYEAETQPPPVAQPVAAPAAATPAQPAAPTRAGAQQSADMPPATIDAIFALNRAERDRQDRIAELTSKAIQRDPHNDEIEPLARRAIEEGWDVQRFELHLLRAERPRGPQFAGIAVPADRPPAADVLEAALCRAGGLATMDTSFEPRVLEQCDRQYRRGISLHELIDVCARANGWRGRSVRSDLRSALRVAFEARDDDRRCWSYGPMSSLSGTSTLSISGILSATVNKFLRESWLSVESAWRRVTAIRSVSDFKAVMTYSLTGDLTYQKVSPGGEIKHGTLGQETYTNRADTYALLLGADRRDLVNDNLGALTSIGKRLGRGGALKLNDVFWTEWLADASTFYTAARGNYDDGSDTAFSADGLTAADVIWQAKTDPDGKPLGLPAKILVVPPAHRIAALRLMSSQYLGADNERGTQNPWAGMYEVVSSVYLANPTYSGYSALAWYMIADPNELPVIETAFLGGVEMPTVEEIELAADHLGLGVRAYHDFGVAKQEYRAALKLKGEA